MIRMLALCLAASTAVSAQSITIGDPSILAIDDWGNSNLLVTQQATLGQDATIQSISFYVTNASGKLRLGIYDATGAGGNPRTLKAATAEIIPVVGWNTANVISPVQLTAGKYWLAYLPSSDNLHFRRSGTGACRYYRAGYGPLPATFATSVISLPDHWSFYATLKAAAPAVSVSIAPTAASVQTGATQQFSATVSGSSNTAVTWTVQEGAAGGTVSSSGLYTAPAHAGIFHVVATSVADATRSAAATVTVQLPSSTIFPLAVHSSGRYLVGANGLPFPILGDAGWCAVTGLGATDQAAYLDDRLSRGFNLVLTMAVARHPGCPHPPFDASGRLPFLKRLDGAAWTGGLSYSNVGSEAPDFTTPDEAYWSGVDTFLQAALVRGIAVAFFPAYNGYHCITTEGWCPEMVANGPARMQAYGTWIAQRYASAPHLIWMLGGDAGTPPARYTAAQQAAEEALATGLKSVSTISRQFSAEWSSPSSGDDIAFVSSILFNDLTLNPAYSWGTLHASARAAYSATAGGVIKPAYVEEEIYEGNPSGAAPWRQYEWLAFLNTAGGFVFGNAATWPFGTGWRASLSSPGAQSMQVLNNFVTTIGWYNLVPSGLAGMRNLVTSGEGSTDEDRVSAAATPDGKLLVAYAAPSHAGPFTLDLTVLAGTSRARWLDPSSGAWTTVANFPNTGTQSFTPPGTNASGFSDWALVLDLVPGLPPSPTGLSAALSVTLTWNSVPGATIYNVYRSTSSQSGPFSLIGGSQSTSYTDVGVTPASTYWYTVSATNGAGEGARSAPILVMP